MAVRIQVPRKSALGQFIGQPWGKVLLLGAACLFMAGLLTFTYYYVKYSRLIDEKLSAGPFPNTSLIFAAPKALSVGDEISVNEIVAHLHRSGYTGSRGNRMGWYNVRPDAVEIFPGPDSYFLEEAGVIKIANGRAVQIISLRDHTERTQYQLEPELITNLFDRKREKRRLIQFADIPPVLKNAILSAEDKRFFQHSGFDPIGIVRAAYVDVKERRNAQGASTLTMQVARMFWLSPERTWRRKIPEVLITMLLEQKLKKPEIFEYYANQVDLGRRGSFSIRGFGEGAQAYFGKDVRQLALPEAAMLAGLAQGPSLMNPFRWPERARNRRNLVLSLMRENGYVSEREYAIAAASPLELARGGIESVEAPYFVDLVNDELQDRFQDHDFQANTYRVYTTLDLNLQKAAAEAVREGMLEVDANIRRRFRSKAAAMPEPQVALVALDVETGDIKALIGGRNYGVSQLNRALAKRQPGSSFKPFVYAAALNTAIRESQHTITPLTTILDEPTTFWFDNKPYEPSNHKREYFGVVTLRQALMKSLNIPTVKLAEAVGYDAVADLARDAGMNLDIQPTPSIALGAYVVTPLEIAGAYTSFVNRGVYTKPALIRYIREASGKVLYESKVQRKAVMDPRVAYLMTNIMESVIQSGTGAGVRGRGFTLPAAGKTGTSHDGWFAGFTSRLICVVWVGFDDNRELKLEGAHSALPVWTAFMKRAHQFKEWRRARPFEAPDGIVSVEIDPVSGQLAGPGCVSSRAEVFITGTQPIEVCRLHGGGTQIAGWEPVAPQHQAPDAASPHSGQNAPTLARSHPPQIPPGNGHPQQTEPREEKPKKRGLFGRIADLFK